VFLSQQRRAIDEIDPTVFDSDAYEQDLDKFPENFKLYQEDYNIYEQAKRYFEENPVGKAQPAQPAQPIHSKDSSWNRRI
jgi:hypothetical protein